MSATFTLDGEGALLAALEHLAASGDDPRRAFRAVADVLRERNRETFQRRGPGWAPLSPAYRKRRRTIGQLTGKLERSLTRKGPRGARERVTRDYVQVSSDLGSAHLFHAGRKAGQSGGRRYPAQPARPVIRVDDRLRREVADVLQQHLVPSRGLGV